MPCICDKKNDSSLHFFIQLSIGCEKNQKQLPDQTGRQKIMLKSVYST